MFARTERLLLRPGWIEDAPALVAALGDDNIARAGLPLPCPFTLDHARDMLTRPSHALRPRLMIFERGRRLLELVGEIALTELWSRVSLACWIRSDRRNDGIATEAGHAMLGISDMLGITELHGEQPGDDAASGAFLHRLGFRGAGASVTRHAPLRRKTASQSRWLVA